MYQIVTWPFVYLWPYSRVRSRYCPAGLVMRAGRDMREASPPLDWPIRLLLRRETDSAGFWWGDRKERVRKGKRDIRVLSRCKSITNQSPYTSTRCYPSPSQPPKGYTCYYYYIIITNYYTTPPINRLLSPAPMSYCCYMLPTQHIIYNIQ